VADCIVRCFPLQIVLCVAFRCRLYCALLSVADCIVRCFRDTACTVAVTIILEAQQKINRFVAWLLNKHSFFYLKYFIEKA
jgi:hypothetical protein